MTPRERVLATLNHKSPDRLPADLMGTAGCLTDPAYFALRDYLGLKGEGRVFRKGENTSYYDERVLERLGVDFRRVWLRPPRNWQPVVMEDGAVSDEWGVLRRRLDNYQSFSAPLGGATVEDLDHYSWPDPFDPGRVEGLAEEAKRLRETTDYAICARAPSLGLFDMAMRLRGMEHFLTDFADDERFAAALIRKVLEVQLGLYQVFLDAVGPYVDMVETSDDYAGEQSPLISPRSFAQIIAPARRELNAFIKSRAPHAKIFLHSDGAITKLIPQFIEIGVDVLNPVEPDAHGNTPEALKCFRSELVFHGHLDTKGALRGSREDVRREVKRVVGGLGSGASYIMAPTNHVQPDIPPENLTEAYSYLREFSSSGGGA